MYTLKKSLGQHFLKDENICRKIVDALQYCSFTKLLEVGPGGGALTKHLLQINAIDFKAVEVDDEKVMFLKNTFPALENRIIHKSFLEIDRPFAEPFAVVGNFPYNISTEILFKILEWEGSVQCVVGMFQKEVAQRIAAKEGSKVYGVTSVLIQAWFDVTYLFDVDERSFIPPPKVKSGVIRLIPRKEPLQMKDRASFFRLVKAAFGQRRKTLRNACKALFDPKVLQQPVFDKRAEQLSVKDFGQLSLQLK
jgi:16S rRNA (adenine1518-N6/adenine1519-N6)-dimethyltransferase